MIDQTVLSFETAKQVNQNIAAFYDSVLMYCLALNETLANNEDPRDGRAVASKMWNRVFMDGKLRLFDRLHFFILLICFLNRSF